MDCPRCNVELKVERYRGLEIDRCPQCEGLWLDHHELGHLEDTVVDTGTSKGTMWMRSFGSDLTCPHCDQQMNWFRYRRYDLEIDHCPAEHGFWLDKGEEKRVLEIMEQRQKDLGRSATAQEDWHKFLSNVGKRSLWDKIKGMFRA